MLHVSISFILLDFFPPQSFAHPSYHSLPHGDHPHQWSTQAHPAIHSQLLLAPVCQPGLVHLRADERVDGHRGSWPRYRAAKPLLPAHHWVSDEGPDWKRYNVWRSIQDILYLSGSSEIIRHSEQSFWRSNMSSKTVGGEILPFACTADKVQVSLETFCSNMREGGKRYHLSLIVAFYHNPPFLPFSLPICPFNLF